MADYEKTKKFGREFKEFLVKGNAMALAIGVVIGGAFQAVVNSLVNDVLMPLISMITAGVDFSEAAVYLPSLRNGEEPVALTYGALITAIINFLIIGFVIFLLMKSVTSGGEAVKKVCKRGLPIEEPKPEPTTKECPFCITEISIKAVRCPHCTSVLEVVNA